MTSTLFEFAKFLRTDCEIIPSFPFTLGGCSGCIFCRSILTISPWLRMLAPLLVAQPSTPKAPKYLVAGIDRRGGGSKGLAAFATGVDRLELPADSWPGVRETEFFLSFLYVPSKYMLTARSRLSPQTSRIISRISGLTESPTKLSKVSWSKVTVDDS